MVRRFLEGEGKNGQVLQPGFARYARSVMVLDDYLVIQSTGVHEIQIEKRRERIQIDVVCP